MNTKITLSGLVPIASSMIHAETADLAGSWKTIDNKTRYAHADVLITKQKNGIYFGEIIKVHVISNRPAIDHCEKHKGTLKNAALISLPIFSGFKQKPKNKDEFIDGHVLNPLSGHMYQAKGRLKACRNVLTLPRFIGMSC